LKIRVIVLLCLCMLILWGCSPKSDEDLFYEAQKQLNKMESYYAQVEITSIGNKGPQQYIMKQWFKKPDKYKLEILSPENLKGKVTISDGSRAWIYNPEIDQTWMMQSFAHSEEQNMFLGYFLKNCLNSESVEVSSKTMDGEDYLIITTDIPGNHVYYHKELLYIHIDTMKPYSLQVYDVKDQLRIEVKYIEFQYNPSLENTIFTINTNESSNQSFWTK